MFQFTFSKKSYIILIRGKNCPTNHIQPLLGPFLEILTCYPLPKMQWLLQETYLINFFIISYKWPNETYISQFCLLSNEINSYTFALDLSNGLGWMRSFKLAPNAETTLGKQTKPRTLRQVKTLNVAYKNYLKIVLNVV